MREYRDEGTHSWGVRLQLSNETQKKGPAAQQRETEIKGIDRERERERAREREREREREGRGCNSTVNT